MARTYARSSIITLVTRTWVSTPTIAVNARQRAPAEAITRLPP